MDGNHVDQAGALADGADRVVEQPVLLGVEVVARDAPDRIEGVGKQQRRAEQGALGGEVGGRHDVGEELSGRHTIEPFLRTSGSFGF